MSSEDYTATGRPELKLITGYLKTVWTMDELAAISLETTPEGGIVMRCERPAPYLWVVPTDAT